jgi:hypothetical protein
LSPLAQALLFHDRKVSWGNENLADGEGPAERVLLVRPGEGVEGNHERMEKSEEDRCYPQSNRRPVKVSSQRGPVTPVRCEKLTLVGDIVGRAGCFGKRQGAVNQSSR